MSDIPVLWLNGAFNHADPWLNVPLYIWGLVLWWVVVVPVVYYLLKMFKWDKYSKFHGLHYAKKNDSAAVLIVDFMGEADMIAEHKAKCIFDYSTDDYEVDMPDVPLNIIRIAGVIVAVLGIAAALKFHWFIGAVVVIAGILMYFVNRVLPWLVSVLFFYPTHYLKDISWSEAILYRIGGINYDCKIAQILQGGEWDRYPVINSGGISVEMVYDNDRWCKKNSPQNKAIKRFCKQWNLDNPTDQIHTFIKFARYHEKGLIKDEDVPEVTFEWMVPWVRIDAGFPFFPKSDYEGKLRQMAKMKTKEKEELFNKYIIYIIGAGVGCLFLILGARFLMKMMSMPKP